MADKQKSGYKARSLGPFHTYPGLKRDFIITVGLIAVLLIIRTISG